jgi:anti-anti-sigma factor
VIFAARSQLDQTERQLVRLALRAGRSWARIGPALGICTGRATHSASGTPDEQHNGIPNRWQIWCGRLEGGRNVARSTVAHLSARGAVWLQLRALRGALGRHADRGHRRARHRHLPRLRAALSSPAGGSVLVILDLSEVTFVDASGLSVILSAHDRLRETGGGLVLTPGPRPAQRLFEITGTDRRLDFLTTPDSNHLSSNIN